MKEGGRRKQRRKQRRRKLGSNRPAVFVDVDVAIDRG